RRFSRRLWRSLSPGFDRLRRRRLSSSPLIIGAPLPSTWITNTSPSSAGGGACSRNGRAWSPNPSTMRSSVLGLGAHSRTRWKRVASPLECHLRAQPPHLQDDPQAEASVKPELPIDRQIHRLAAPSDQPPHRARERHLAEQRAQHGRPHPLDLVLALVVNVGRSSRQEDSAHEEQHDQRSTNRQQQAPQPPLENPERALLVRFCPLKCFLERLLDTLSRLLYPHHRPSPVGNSVFANRISTARRPLYQVLPRQLRDLIRILSIKSGFAPN